MTYVTAQTDPKVTFFIRSPPNQRAILPLSFTAAIIDGFKHLLAAIAAAKYNQPIPAVSLIFIVGQMVISVKRIDLTANPELDCLTLGLVFSSLWSLVSRHEHRTCEFDIARREPRLPDA